MTTNQRRDMLSGDKIKKIKYDYGRKNTLYVEAPDVDESRLPKAGDILFYKKRGIKEKRLNQINQWKFICVETEGKKKGKGKSAAPSATPVSETPTPASGVEVPNALIENPTAKPKRRKSRMSVAGALAEERRLELQKLQDGPEAEDDGQAGESGKKRKEKQRNKTKRNGTFLL